MLSGTSVVSGTITPITVTTLASGAYTFNNLTPGTYAITETQPTGYDDGLDTRGTQNSGTVGNDVISGIALAAGVNGQNNNFRERNPAVGNTVWEDLNGNGVIDAGEPGVGGVQVKLYNSNNVLIATTVMSVAATGAVAAAVATATRTATGIAATTAAATRTAAARTTATVVRTARTAITPATAALAAVGGFAAGGFAVGVLTPFRLSVRLRARRRHRREGRRAEKQ